MAWGRVEDALAFWRDVMAASADRDVPGLTEDTDRFAETLAAAKQYTDAAVVARPAVEAARQQGRPELFWRIADHLAFYLERMGRLEEATGLWREAVNVGSDVPRTFDRLSLVLDRAGNPKAAAEVCEMGMQRFSIEARRTKLAQQIEKRGQRCRAKAASLGGWFPNAGLACIRDRITFHTDTATLIWDRETGWCCRHTRHAATVSQRTCAALKRPRLGQIAPGQTRPQRHERKSRAQP